MVPYVKKQKNKNRKTKKKQKMPATLTFHPQTPFFKIYQKIFPPLIRLAVDIDPVTKQLFEPLLFQIIHWFTKNVSFESVETMALLDAIVDAVGNESDGALRDFSAKALSEFFVWSIKQTTTKVSEKQTKIIKNKMEINKE